MIQELGDGTFKVLVQGNVPCWTNDGKTWELHFGAEQMKTLAQDLSAHFDGQEN